MVGLRRQQVNPKTTKLFEKDEKKIIKFWNLKNNSPWNLHQIISMIQNEVSTLKKFTSNDETYSRLLISP